MPRVRLPGARTGAQRIGTPSKLTRCLRLARAAGHVVEAAVRILVIFPWLTHTQQRRQVRRWSQRALAIFDLHLTGTGAPTIAAGSGSTEVRLYAGNHVSWLDVFAIWATTETQFVAKAEVARWPVVGLLARQLGVIFIDRSRRTEVVEIGSVITSELARGRSVCIFPEGTTTEGEQLQPFRPALFQPAIDAGIAVQPLAIRYLRADGSLAIEAAFTGEMTLVQSMWALSASNSLTIDVSASELLPTLGQRRRDVAQWCHDRVQQMLAMPPPPPLRTGAAAAATDDLVGLGPIKSIEPAS